MTTVQITPTDSYTTKRAEFIAVISNPKWMNGTSRYPFLVIVHHQLCKIQNEFKTHAKALLFAIEKQDRLRVNITDEFDTDTD